MKTYYVNDTAQKNGDHEVHTDECPYFKSITSKTRLGVFSNCKDAVDRSKKIYPNSDGCAYCCPECHKR
ncbi:hypothetical protein [Flavobacterium sp. N502536]|uniref:hypothetical protein n=1 Tax=Flavobacterium sp. N502536 TaxID=2986837 RepID=UPI002223971C|nr:hypothetical protein [Flavobacterium sp. N502536]